MHCVGIIRIGGGIVALDQIERSKGTEFLSQPLLRIRNEGQIELGAPRLLAWTLDLIEG